MSTTAPSTPRSWRIPLPVTAFFCFIGFSADCFNAGMAILGQVFLAVDRFGANERQLGLLGAATSLGYALPVLFTGLLSERVGRRTLVTLSLCGLTIVYLITPHVTTLSALITVSFFRSLSSSFLWPPVMAWITDAAPRAALSKLLGRYNISWAAGICAGFYLSGWIYQRYGAYVTFTIAAILAVGTLLIVIITEPQARESWGELSGDRRTDSLAVCDDLAGTSAAFFWVRRALMLMGIGCALQEMILYLTPKLVGAGAHQELEGRLLATRMAGQVLAFAWFASHGDAWHFRRWPLAAGLASFAAGALVLGIGSSQIWLWQVGYALIGFGVGAGFMQSAYYTLSLLKNKGLGSGIMETLVGGGAFLGPLFGGYLAWYVNRARPDLNGPRVALLATLVPLVLLAFYVLRPSSRSAPAPDVSPAT